MDKEKIKEFRVLKGKPISEQIQQSVSELISKMGFQPHVVAILVGDDKGAESYAKIKKKKAEKFGINMELMKLPARTTQQELIDQVAILGNSSNVHGIMVERPLPKHMDFDIISGHINPKKDVDCQSAESLGRILLSNASWFPATAAAVIKILEYYKIQIDGADVVIIGRSLSVGKPLAGMLLQKAYNATVTVCHSHTKGLKEKAKQADILIAAIGKPEFIDDTFVKNGAIVIDVGTNYTKDGLFGDVDFDKTKEIAGAISPVPGGVGPVTVSVLMENCAKAANENSPTEQKLI